MRNPFCGAFGLIAFAASFCQARVPFRESIWWSNRELVKSRTFHSKQVHDTSTQNYSWIELPVDHFGGDGTTCMNKYFVQDNTTNLVDLSSVMLAFNLCLYWSILPTCDWNSYRYSKVSTILLLVTRIRIQLFSLMYSMCDCSMGKTVHLNQLSVYRIPSKRHC